MNNEKKGFFCAIQALQSPFVYRLIKVTKLTKMHLKHNNNNQYYNRKLGRETKKTLVLHIRNFHMNAPFNKKLVINKIHLTLHKRPYRYQALHN
jgi:hypothetical protein